MKSDQELISQLQGILDQLAAIRRNMESKDFGYKRNGCVCEGTALCAHHAAIWDHLNQASDNLAHAINQAQREE